MTDPQQTIDEIRTFLQSSDQTLTDRIKEVARQYAAACQEANQRLSRCAEYLRKGLRTEAIHLAQSEPQLLDLVSMLDFPERSKWEEMATFYDLPVPPALKLDTAAAINEAYADDQPLEELLRKHRLLALARAPLGPRLRLLRRIAQLDPHNMTWQDDLREFEKARHKQMQGGLRTIIQKNDTNALLSLQDELVNSEWTVAPPAYFVQQVQSAARQSHQARTLGDLEPLEAQLDEAMSAFDLARAQQLRDQWQRLVTTARLDGQGPLFERAQVVFDWIAEQERRQTEEAQYERAVGELQAGLDARLPRERLEGLAGKVLDFGRGMPEHVDLRYRGRMQQIRRNRTLRLTALIGGPIAAVALIAVLVGLYLNHRSHVQKLATETKTLQDLVDGNRMKDARAHFEGLAPDLRTAEPIAALEGRLRKMEKDENDRQEVFRQALKTAEEAPLDDSGDGAVKRAEALARLPAEIDAVNDLKNDRGQRVAAQNKARDETFSPRITALQDEVGKLEDMLTRGGDAEKLAGLVYQQESQASRLAADARDAGPVVRQRIDGLSKRLETVRTKLGQQNRQVKLLDELTRALTGRQDLPGFVMAAEAYNKEFGSTDRARDFKRALGERELWQAVLDWNRLIKPRLAAPLDLGTAEAGSLAADCEAFLKKNPSYPDQTAIELYANCLKAYPQREDAGSDTAAAELRTAFAGLMLKDLQMVRTPEGKIYYTTTEEDLDARIKKSLDNYVRFPYLVSYDGKTKPALLKLNLLEKYGPAPQSLLAAQVKQVPKNFGDKNWDRTLIGLALKVKDNAEIDPVLRVILLKQVLEVAGKGSYPLWLALDECRTKLEKADIDLTVAWMDPDSKDAQAARPVAKEFLNQFPDLNLVLKKAAELRDTVETSITRSARQPVGWLVKRDNRWVCATTAALPDRYELAVVQPGSDGKAAWFTVGTALKGEVSIDPFKQEGLVEGRWVWARKVEP